MPERESDGGGREGETFALPPGSPCHCRPGPGDSSGPRWGLRRAEGGGRGAAGAAARD